MEEKLNEEKLGTKVKKNQTAKVGEKYSYKYVDIAQIHDYLEENHMRYYQYIDRIGEDDYIMTQKLLQEIDEDGSYIKDSYIKWGEALRGCRVVEATLYGVDNPAQQQGSALTYARRYSLLMAFGLATEDDDAQSLSRLKVEIKTKEQAEQYKITFGKYSGKTLKEIVETQKDYANWLYTNGDETIKSCLNLMKGNR